MSFSTTSLQLINKVNRRRRIKDSGGITTLEELTTLDMLNRSIGRVMSEKEWEFNIRHAQMTTKALIPDVTVTVTAGSTSVIVQKTGLEDADLFGDYITRVSMKGSTDYSNTSMRVISFAPVISNAGIGTMVSSLGSAVSTTTGEMFYAEYLLPDTVKNLVQAAYQEDPLTLNQIGARVEFNELYPRPLIRTSSPEEVSVGGFDVSTYSTGLAQPAQLRMIVWPVPDDEYVIDYTYEHRHAELTAVADVLEGVPPEVVDLIVDGAVAGMKGDYDRLRDDANDIRAESTAAMENIHDRHRGMSTDRATVGNWDGYSQTGDAYGIARGRTIGGN